MYLSLGSTPVWCPVVWNVQICCAELCKCVVLHCVNVLC